MKNVFFLIALTGTLAACEDPLGDARSSQNDDSMMTSTEVDSRDRDQDQDRQGQGGS